MGNNMGYKFNVTGTWYSVKTDGEYPWPHKGDPNRTVYLGTDDILQFDERKNAYTKVTGLGLCNILIPEDQLITHENEPKDMVMV